MFNIARSLTLGLREGSLSIMDGSLMGSLTNHCWGHCPGFNNRRITVGVNADSKGVTVGVTVRGHCRGHCRAQGSLMALLSIEKGMVSVIRFDRVI